MGIPAVYHKWGLSILKVATAIIALLLGGWMLTGTVQAAVGLEIEATRSNGLLIATAKTVEGSEIIDDSWSWVKSEECNLGLFTVTSGVSNSGDARGKGWTVDLESDDAGMSYCFYVEDTKGRRAVASAKVEWPQITIEQSNDQLVATVTNVEEANLVVNEATWQWYRYAYVQGSGFGCNTDYHDLDEEELRVAADLAETIQIVLTGEVVTDVYETQKNVYKAGGGSIVDLTEEDEGMNFCFQVQDSAGISNSRHITVGDVVISEDSGKPIDTGNNVENVVDTVVIDGVVVDVDEEGVGEVSVSEDAEGAGNDVDSSNDTDDATGMGDNNVIRNTGFVLLALAVIGGIIMIIKRSQIEDEENEEV